MKLSLALMSALLLTALIAMPAMPDQRRALLSPTRSFAIDGKRFVVEEPPGDKPPSTGEALREAGGTARENTMRYPQGLRADHSLRLESEPGPVDISFGSMEARGPQVRRRMSSTGWECFEPARGQAAVAIMKKGRETTIVLLDEKEGKFLLLRKPE